MLMTGILINIGSSRERVYGGGAREGAGERLPVAGTT
jgi:hypothetical protein